MNATSHLHAHLKGDAKYKHQRADRSLAILAWAVGLTLTFAAVEVVAGFMANSLALLADAVREAGRPIAPTPGETPVLRLVKTDSDL